MTYKIFKNTNRFNGKKLNMFKLFIDNIRIVMLKIIPF